MKIGIVLAAGQSRRFKSQKLLFPINDKPLVVHSITNGLNSPLDRLIVIVDPLQEKVIHTIDTFFHNHPKLQLINNETAVSGLISSLQCGLRAVPPECVAVVVLLADMPFVPAAVITTLLDIFISSQKIVIPVCNGQWQHPRVIPACFFPEFLALAPAEKGTTVLERHPEALVLVPIEQPSYFIDIDRIEDTHERHIQ